jgi:hypothetical protein
MPGLAANPADPLNCRNEERFEPGLNFRNRCPVVIGGLTSFETFLVVVAAHDAHREVERVKLKALHSNFIVEGARLFGGPQNQQVEETTRSIQLHAMVGHMRFSTEE